MSSRTAKLIAFLLSIFILAYIAVQAMQSFWDEPYETAFMTKASYRVEMDLNGFFVRDETVIDAQSDGIVRYHYANAEKLAKNSLVASIYPKEQDLVLLQRLEDLARHKEVLQKSQEQASVEGLKLDLLTQKISQNRMSLIRMTNAGNFDTLDDVYYEMMLNADRLAICMDAEQNIPVFNSKIEEIDAEMDTLSGQISEKLGEIRTPDSGFFSNTADGYEEIFTPEMLSSLTPFTVDSYVENHEPKSVSSIGRIAFSDEWYYVATLPRKKAALIHEGDTLTFQLASNAERQIPVTVSQIIAEDGDEEAVIVLQGDYLDASLIALRFEKAVVSLKEYTGIVIPKEAIRVQKIMDDNGDAETSTGVYVLIGKTVYFRKVSPLYEDEDVLVSDITTAGNYVSVYDQVILKGKELGNIVQ